MNGDANDERRLALGAVKVLGLLSPPMAAGAWLVAGWQGAISALIGLSFVLVLFGGSAALLTYVARHRTAARGVSILAVGAVVRLPLYVVALVLLDRVAWIHGRSLAAATAMAIAVTLGHELNLLRRMPRLFWIDAGAATPAAVVNDTRSRAL